MILKAKHSFFLYPFFRWYTRFRMKRNFHQVYINGKFEDRNLPVMLLSNHVSWWDGFWLEYFNLKLLHRKLHFMMLEDQLQKHWFFNYSGGFSVRKSSKSIIESLKYTAEIMQDPENMVFMFPQGRIRSMLSKELKFENGIEKILTYCKNDIHILFVANFLEYLSQPKPSLYIHFSEYEGISKNTADLENAYNTFYGNALRYHYNLAE